MSAPASASASASASTSATVIVNKQDIQNCLNDCIFIEQNLNRMDDSNKTENSINKLIIQRVISVLKTLNNLETSNVDKEVKNSKVNEKIETSKNDDELIEVSKTITIADILKKSKEKEIGSVQNVEELKQSLKDESLDISDENKFTYFNMYSFLSMTYRQYNKATFKSDSDFKLVSFDKMPENFKKCFKPKYDITDPDCRMTYDNKSIKVLMCRDKVGIFNPVMIKLSNCYFYRILDDFTGKKYYIMGYRNKNIIWDDEEKRYKLNNKNNNYKVFLQAVRLLKNLVGEENFNKGYKVDTRINKENVIKNTKKIVPIRIKDKEIPICSESYRYVNIIPSEKVDSDCIEQAVKNPETGKMHYRYIGNHFNQDSDFKIVIMTVKFHGYYVPVFYLYDFVNEKIINIDDVYFDSQPDDFYDEDEYDYENENEDEYDYENEYESCQFKEDDKLKDNDERFKDDKE